MIYENYFKDMFESISEYRKIVLFLVLIKKDKDFYRGLVLVNVILFE